MGLFDRERRKFLRLPCAIEAEYVPLSNASKTPISSAGRNVSIGGVCLITFEPLKRDQIIEMKLTFPGLTRPINAQGKIKWSAPIGAGGKDAARAYDTGIEFTRINDEDRKVLDKFITSTAKKK